MVAIADYLIQYAAGTGPLAAEALRQALPDGRELFADDSAMLVTSRRELTSADPLPFANNAFRVIARAPRSKVPAAIRRLVAQLPGADLAPAGRQGFRVMAQIDGQLTSIDRSARATLEQALAAKVRARVTSRGGGAEYWLIGRTDLNEFLLGHRLPKQRSRKVAAGALAPELSSMLIAASRPDRRDRFLDPFAGSGALLAARLAQPFRRLDYVDEQLAELRPNLPDSLLRKRDNVRLSAGDARRLTMIDDHDVDVIVTDPPWGEHADVDGPYETFVAEVAAEFDRVLQARHGRLVLLSSRRRADQWAAALGPLAADRSLEILINGHPATVLIGSR
ncbi:TRM11 family SAM-dependent methyltransferase [Microlunatus speluncae]|uniref:TRM11 family SAM-dependent methyltransferase n=1 Tax=Microlunatus speluncae TaxID=2594267 RepID=UPI00126686A2|nr:hypothetical protein [Microlunatus speluncae]